MERLTKLVSEFYGVDFDKFRKKGRGNQKETIAKSMAIVLISDFLPGSTVVQMGDFFKKHYTTIVYLRRTMIGEINVNRFRKIEYLDLSEKISKMEFVIKNKKIIR